jgi:hypothetical protein
MTRVRALTAALLIAAAIGLGPTVPVAGQAGDKYTARLGWVPIDGQLRASVTGKGSVTATLTGTRLALTGSFEGLASPATVARLHRGVAKGARGPVIGDLTITQGKPSGTITGSFNLAPEQLEALKQGRLYVQVHSAKGVPPDGDNLWGWLLK